LRIGRSSENDIKVSDISVSRTHASLYINNNNFYIIDNLSKFGTHIQMQNEFLVIPEKPLGMHSGKIQLKFTISRNCLSFLRCYKNKRLFKKDYNEYLKNLNPIYYMQELENVNVLDTNFSVKVSESKGLKNNTKPEEEDAIKNNERQSHSNNIINQEINDDNENSRTVNRFNNNIDDITVSRVNSEENSIINATSNNIVDHTSRTNLNFGENSNYDNPSELINFIHNPIISRLRERESREDMRIENKTAKIINSRRNTANLNRPVLLIDKLNKINEENLNDQNENFYSDKTKKTNMNIAQSKNAYENIKYKPDSVKSKENIAIYEFKGSTYDNRSIIDQECDSIYEFDFNLAAEKVPYVKNQEINKSKSNANNSERESLKGNSSNKFKIDSERINIKTNSPVVSRQHEIKTTEKKNPEKKNNSFHISNFADNLENKEQNHIKKSREESHPDEMDNILFNAINKLFNNDNNSNKACLNDLERDMINLFINEVNRIKIEEKQDEIVENENINKEKIKIDLSKNAKIFNEIKKKEKSDFLHDDEQYAIFMNNFENLKNLDLDFNFLGEFFLLKSKFR